VSKEKQLGDRMPEKIFFNEGDIEVSKEKIIKDNPYCSEILTWLSGPRPGSKFTVNERTYTCQLKEQNEDSK
jgi:hypothetical protein